MRPFIHCLRNDKRFLEVCPSECWFVIRGHLGLVEVHTTVHKDAGCEEQKQIGQQVG